ncbi:prolyl 4-hydroxylase subunit alpha-1-like isoform X2 [Mytilus trossulus]|uniref:prolyl 4-hydroxylase subunit alpha-1-like isoform X2 n=1 Tax=Mytilus trossulus TaxID=6551 RepID=UPI003004BB66
MMSVRKLLVSVIITVNIFSCIGILFTCTKHFEDSKRTVYNLSEYIESLNGYNELKRISERLRDQISEECNRNTTTLPNPVSMYLYAKTVNEALSPIRDTINKTDDVLIKETMISFISNLPTGADVEGVILSFVKLQNTYNVSSRDMASGYILGIKVPTLTAFDCFDIGLFMFKKGYNRLAIQWFYTTLTKQQEIKSTKQNIKIFRSIIIGLIENAKRQEIKAEKETRMRIAFTTLQKDDDSKFKQNLTAELHAMLKNKTIKFYGPELDRNLKVNKNYEFLCRKQILYSEGYCKYLGYPFIGFYYRPIKIEIINISPRIIVVHDIINIDVISHFTAKSFQLSRSEVVNLKGNDSNVQSDHRTSSTFKYLDDTDYPSVGRLNNFLERLTGLRMNKKQADHFQIVNYGIGGEYKPHYDWVEEKYLSDVEIGGSTVFPHLNIAVPPKKGSALFFTNLDEKGHGDTLTLHAGCPVFFGSKWIANKWVHTKDQDMNFLQTVPSVWM